jgi:hypothetical protein
MACFGQTPANAHHALVVGEVIGDGEDDFHVQYIG